MKTKNLIIGILLVIFLGIVQTAVTHEKSNIFDQELIIEEDLVLEDWMINSNSWKNV